MLAKRLTVDTKTGKEAYEDFEFTNKAPSPKVISINPQKLINVLKNKGIINNAEELS